MIGMGVTKSIVDRNRGKHMATCRVCRGEKKLPCGVCDGERTLRYIPPEAPVPLPGTKMASIQCCCAMCEGIGLQICPNCLGEGSIFDPAFLSDAK